MDTTDSDIRALVRVGRLSEALALVQGSSAPKSAEARCTRELQKAELLQFNGRNQEARETTERLLRNRPPPGLEPRCELVLGQICQEERDPGRAAKHFQTAVRLSRAFGDMRLMCQAQSKLLTTLADSSTPSAVLALLRETERNIASYGDTQSAADFHTRVAQIEATQGNFTCARQHLSAAQMMLGVDENLWLEGATNLAASAIYFLASDLLVAQQYASKALKCALESGHARQRMAATANQGLLDLHLGNLREADRHISEAIELSKQFPVSRISLLDSYAQLQLVRRRNDECNQLLAEIDEIVSVHEPSVLSWQRLAVSPTRVRSFQASHQWARSNDVASEMAAVADEKRDTLHQVSLRVLGTDSLVELGRLDEAAELILEASDLADDVPLAVLAEVERARAAVLARTGGRDVARRPFERSLRILSAMGGIAPRMDAAMSYQRAMQQMNVGLREHVKAQPWNLKPLVDHTFPGKAQPGDSKSRTARPGVEITDLLWLGHLVWKPSLLAQEAFVLLRESDHATAVAVVERAQGRPERVTACEGWSVEQARREAASPHKSIKLPLGTAHDTELELLVEAADTLHSHTFVRDFARYIQQARTLSAFQEAEREQLSLMSPEALFASEDGVFISESMRKLVATAKTVAATDFPILITGETGTGKEVIARLIHKYSGRADRDFLPYNCTGVPKDMVESQLFGHKRGAFTSAHENSLGVVRTVEGGTLLLDEIGEIELGIQPKLLRFLDNKEVHPLGEARPVKVDVRIIAATNANLDDLVRKGLFREDLLYRINVMTLTLPPLRERREEILPLAHHFLRRFGTDTGRPNLRITEDAQKCLLLHEWPGNVRRLANELRRAVALTEGDGPVGLAQLSPDVIEAGRAIGETVLTAGVDEGQAVTIQTNQRLADAVAHLEHVMIRRTLKRVDGHGGLAARALGISRKGFYLKRRRLGFDDL